MARKYDPYNPFRFKVIIKYQSILVTMIYRSKVRKLKREFALLPQEWMDIERFKHTAYNIHSMRFKLLNRYISPLFSQEERLYPEYMQICLDAGKAIEKALQANEVSA